MKPAELLAKVYDGETKGSITLCLHVKALFPLLLLE
jgi:hypothetical protein